MTNPAEVASDLRTHLALAREILQLAERESHGLRSPELGSSAFELHRLRKDLLPRLDASLVRLRSHRVAWQRLSQTQRLQHPEIAALLRQNQDLIMKVLVLDRENDQARLRRGLLPPGQLPPVAQNRPHFVADLYRRHSS
jgi:hypothetical protein